MKAYSALIVFLVLTVCWTLAPTEAQTGNRRNIFGVSTSKNLYGKGSTIRRNILGRKWGNNARMIGVKNIGTRIYGIRRISFGHMVSAEGVSTLRGNYFGSSKKVFDSTVPNGRIPDGVGPPVNKNIGKVMPMSDAEIQREFAQYRGMIDLNSEYRRKAVAAGSGKGPYLAEF